MDNKQQILIIHGGTTYPNYEKYLESLKNKSPKLEWIAYRKDWKNELQEQLGDNYIVYTPQMPNKTNSQYEEWKIYFEKIVDLLDENFILVGHSLGAIFLVKYLSENKVSKKIKKVCLLGTPFNDEGMELEPLCSFLRIGDLKNMDEQISKLYFYHSEDDFAVPYNHIEKYEKELSKAIFRKYKDQNHFLVEKIPDLLNDIKN